VFTEFADIAPYPMPGTDSMPRNTARWEPDPRRAVLLVHDMQRYFLRPFPESAEPGGPLLRNTTRLRETCARLGVPVAYTAQPGRMTEVDRGLLKDFWGAGMQTTPEDREIAAPLRPAEGDWVLTKWRYSAFHRSDLLERMRRDGRDQLILCGVYAHVGVLMTACEAFTHNIEAFLAADAVADFSADEHRLALDYAAARCAVVATTDRLVDTLVLGATG